MEKRLHWGRAALVVVGALLLAGCCCNRRCAPCGDDTPVHCLNAPLSKLTVSNHTQIPIEHVWTDKGEQFPPPGPMVPAEYHPTLQPVGYVYIQPVGSTALTQPTPDSHVFIEMTVHVYPQPLGGYYLIPEYGPGPASGTAQPR